jgi:hypothetical protein
MEHYDGGLRKVNVAIDPVCYLFCLPIILSFLFFSNHIRHVLTRHLPFFAGFWNGVQGPNLVLHDVPQAERMQEAVTG